MAVTTHTSPAGLHPKADGKSLRPLGIPTFEDKVLQRAVTMILEAVYEQDLMNCSYGFRPKRSAHQALLALWEGIGLLAAGWWKSTSVDSSIT